MAAQLGIGVRVFVGWAPRDRSYGNAANCVIGVIIDGPLPAGSISAWPPKYLRNVDGETVKTGFTNHPAWVVEVRKGQLVASIEPLLTPIDDDPSGRRVGNEVEVRA